MKTYSFPVTGEFGKYDSWDDTFDFELSDEDAVRLEQSAKSYLDIDEDLNIADIYDKIWNAAYEDQIYKILSDRIRLADLRSDYMYDHEEPVTDLILAQQEMERTTFRIHFPEDLM